MRRTYGWDVLPGALQTDRESWPKSQNTDLRWNVHLSTNFFFILFHFASLRSASLRIALCNFKLNLKSRRRTFNLYFRVQFMRVFIFREFRSNLDYIGKAKLWVHLFCFQGKIPRFVIKTLSHAKYTKIDEWENIEKTKKWIIAANFI